MGSTVDQWYWVVTMTESAANERTAGTACRQCRRATGRRLRCSGWLLVVATWSVPALAATPYVVRHWGTEQGLPPGPGACVLQTRDGHVWLGMEEGLVRLAGGHATIFDSFNTREMKGNVVSTLFEDRDGNLWAGNGKWGLLRISGGQFKRYGREAGLANEMVSTIGQDSAGSLWVGTDGGGLFRFEDERFIPVTFPGAEPRPFINRIAGMPDGTVWVAYEDALRRIRGSEHRLFDTNHFPATRIEALHVDQRGQLWVGGQGFVAREADGEFIPIPWQPGWEKASALASSPDGTLWMGTAHGVVRLQGAVATVYDTASGLAGNLVTRLILDREGSVWLCNNASGVDQLRPSRFEIVGTQQGLSHPAVTSVLEDTQGAVWIATEDGVNRIVNGVNTAFRQSEGLSWNMVFTLAEDDQGTIWAGSWRGLNRFEDGRFVPVVPEPPLPSSTFWCSYRDGDGTLWFGTAKGLVSHRDGRFKTWDHASAGLSHDDVRCILRDRDGRLWVGTSYGLNRMDGGRFRNYFEAAADQPFNVVLALHEDPEGGIWFGTQGDGLFRYGDDRFTRFTTAHRLFDNLIHAIIEDHAGYFWLTSNRGLFRVSRRELEAVARGEQDHVQGRVFTQADGLPTAAFNGTVQPVAWKARDGRLWFATMAGAVAAAPGRMFTNHVPPAVSIESIEVDGAGRLARAGTLVVPPGSERLAFSYSVLSYVSPKAVRSRYRLEGFDKQWATNAGRHEVQYTALQPGSYRFQVAAANGDGVWNEEGASLAVLVQPFPWQTAWFQIGAGMLILGGLMWSVHTLTARRHRLTLEALERRHALERERTRIASDLHDDVGSNLGSITLLSREVERRAAGHAVITEDLAEINRLAQETSDSMRDIVWFINPDEDTVEKLLLRMKDVAASLLGGIPCHFEAAGLVGHTRLSPQFKRQFFLIFKEALHNIRKHAAAARVIIRLTGTSGRLALEILDDGVGFSGSDPGRGHGLASMRRRARESGWALDLGSEPGRGTRVCLEANLH